MSKGEQQKWKRRHCSRKEFKKAFAKMLLRSRDVDMKGVLQYSLRPFPLPLATSDG